MDNDLYEMSLSVNITQKPIGWHMRRSDDRILTTHVGSLPRGEQLTELLLAQERDGLVDRPTFTNAVFRAVEAVVTSQAECGIDIPCDGEMPRISFSTYVPRRMSGFSGESARPLPLDAVHYPKWFEWMQQSGLRRARVYNAPEAVSDVCYEDLSDVRDECEIFQSVIDQNCERFLETFMTAASPGIVATTMINRYYDSHEAYLLAVARELRKEYHYIVDAGFTLQIDAPDLAMERAGFFQNQSLSEFKKFVEMHITALNFALDGIPAEKVRLHACWGNRNSPHVHDIPCPEILPLLYQAKVGAISLPFANPRHAHEVEAFHDYPLPDHMILMPGVIETVTNYVEHPKVVAERLIRAVNAIRDRERVIASTDCGFSTLAGDAFVAEDVVWAKLSSLVEGAQIASKCLWGRS